MYILITTDSGAWTLIFRKVMVVRPDRCPSGCLMKQLHAAAAAAAAVADVAVSGQPLLQ